ncbi:MAG TPA: glycosyltransferase family 9 protein [Dissulfurispiraceae bacterium]
MRKTFVHHDGALGDVLLSLPALDVIREAPGVVHFAGRPDIADLLKNAGYVEETSPADSALFLSLYAEDIDERAGEFLAGFGRAFVFTMKGDSPLAGSIGKVVPDTKTVLAVPPGGSRVHLAEFRLRQLAPDRDSCRDAHLAVPAVYRERARQFLADAAGRDTASALDAGRPLIVLHPGSGGAIKCWPLERFLGLIGRLEEEYDPVLLILSGPAESPEWKESIRRFARGRGATVHAEGVELITVAALLDMSSLYIGNDSGITHLAAAAGGNVVAVFGPTDPALWRPCGSRVSVLLPKAACAPCEPLMRGNSDCGMECLYGISEERVFEACKSRLSTG